jgi:DNA polymerase-3 subunit epsilon
LRNSSIRQILASMREIVFDTETTGLDPKTGDRMVEIGCVEMIGRVETGNTFHAYYNPERDMPIEAENVHGLSAAFLSTKPLFSEGVDDLLEFLGDAPLVAHNAGFDFGFLNAELERLGREPISLDRMIDTVAIARKKHPGAKNSLDALCTRYGVDRSHRVKHGALLDAELLAQVYVELKGGRQIGLELATSESVIRVEASVMESRRTQKVERARREPRPHTASASELARHAEFVSGIKDAIWSR